MVEPPAFVGKPAGQAEVDLSQLAGALSKMMTCLARENHQQEAGKSNHSGQGTRRHNCCTLTSVNTTVWQPYRPSEKLRYLVLEGASMWAPASDVLREALGWPKSPFNLFCKIDTFFIFTNSFIGLDILSMLAICCVV